MDGDRTVVAINVQGANSEPAIEESFRNRSALMEFSLPQEIISSLIERMGGEYRAPIPGDPRFLLHLPSA
jgi:hypothetical protein